MTGAYIKSEKLSSFVSVTKEKREEKIELNAILCHEDFCPDEKCKHYTLPRYLSAHDTVLKGTVAGAT